MRLQVALILAHFGAAHVAERRALEVLKAAEPALVEARLRISIHRIITTYKNGHTMRGIKANTHTKNTEQ